MGTWFRRLAYLLRPSRHDAELREEIEAHRALRAAQLERDGMTTADAAAASRRAVGNVLLAREDAGDVWRGSLAAWPQDVRYAVRALRHNAAFTAVAVATLALGIGVNTGLFSVLNGVLFRDLPAPDAHELVSIAQTVEGGRALTRTGSGTFSVAEYGTYRARARTLAGLLAHSNPTPTILGGSTPQQIVGLIVSCTYFDVLRQPPARGRALIPADCEPGASPVVVLGHDLWATAFAADSGIVGRAIELNRRSFTVVGVAARGTYGGSPYATGYFAPISADPVLGPVAGRAGDASHLWLYLVGRRAAGTGLEQVRAELAVVAAQIDQEQTGRTTALAIRRATPMALDSGARGLAIGAAAVLMAAFGVVLLIACANVANLLLARGSARSREIAVRLSLGASRGRVIRQLLTESLLIAIAGGVLGSVVAFSSFQSLVALALPAIAPPWSSTAYLWDLSPDVRVLTFAVVLTLATAILFGVVPALVASRSDPGAVIKDDATGAGGDRRGRRVRGALVGVQVALCMMLMMSAGLLLRGLQAAYTVDPGFDVRGVGYVMLQVPRTGDGAAEAAGVQQRLAEAIRAMPGVEQVVSAMQTPFGDEDVGVSIRLPGQPADDVRFAKMNVVEPGYFALLGMPIVRGRTFTGDEAVNPGAGPRPAIVSATTAGNLWPGEDPIGRTMLWGDDTLRVVGVAVDAHVSTLGAADPYYFYLPGGNSVLLFKSRTDLDATAAAIRAAGRDIDPGVVVRVFPLAANVAQQRAISRVVASLGGGLGLLALVLAAVGIYGVVSYAVTRRFREIGIRMALGASRRHLLHMILRHTFRPVVAGAAIGVAAAGATSRVLSGVLFGVSPTDPIGLGGAALFVLGIALVSAALAAMPAIGAAPTATLRSE